MRSPSLFARYSLLFNKRPCVFEENVSFLLLGRVMVKVMFFIVPREGLALLLKANGIVYIPRNER